VKHKFEWLAYPILASDQKRILAQTVSKLWEPTIIDSLNCDKEHLPQYLPNIRRRRALDEKIIVRRIRL
jgi:hypothetical protein